MTVTMVVAIKRKPGLTYLWYRWACGRFSMVQVPRSCRLVQRMRLQQIHMETEMRPVYSLLSTLKALPSGGVQC